MPRDTAFGDLTERVDERSTLATATEETSLLPKEKPAIPRKHCIRLTVLFIVVAAAVAVIALLYINSPKQVDWDSLDRVLLHSINLSVFPGAVAIVGNKHHNFYLKALGNYTYGLPPPFRPPHSSALSPAMSTDTRFDLASCTKVVATTSSIALLYQDGLLDLHAPVTAFLGSNFSANGKGAITVLNLMLHNAGFPPDPYPDYWYAQFGCEQTNQSHPKEVFDCRENIYASLMNQTLINHVGQKYVYSDLSMITAMFVAGSIVRAHALFYNISSTDLIPGCVSQSAGDSQCWFEAFLRLRVFTLLEMHSTGFLQPVSDWGLCAPAENDTFYQRVTLQGQVSDQNAYAMGGISGHAGLFSTVSDIAQLLRDYLFHNHLFNRTTVSFFTNEYNRTQSNRAIGWGINDDRYVTSCGHLSNRTFEHLGYTGTVICGDPVREAFVVLLTNRVYPTDVDISIFTEAARNFSNKAAALLDQL